MELVATPPMRIGQIQLYTEGVLQKCEPFGELDEKIAPVQGTFQEFLEAMLKVKEADTKKRILDRASDSLIRPFYHQVLGEIGFPHTSPSAQKAQEALLELYEKYGPKISAYSYTDQPAAVDNMLKDLAKIDLNALGDSGLGRWLQPIQEANDNFKRGSVDFADEQQEMQEQDAASAIAPLLTSQINELIRLFFSNAVIGKNKKLTKAYEQLVIFIKTFR